MVSSSVGSSTMTGWKRRSRAASFSMYLRYSSSVVAPMHCISPRDSGGLEDVGGIDGALGRASADDRVQLVDEEDDVVGLRSSSMTALRRSSNWPRYLVPATREPMSSVRTRLSASDSGTSPLTMRWAKPSAMAVLPTPGSPMSAGLFLRRAKDLDDPLDLLFRAR